MSLVELILCIKPLKLIIASEYRPVHPVTALFDDLFGMYTVQTVLALVCAAAVCAIFRCTKYAYMDVSIVYSRQFDLSKQM